MDKYIGKRLDGRYEIVELIGSGGMANVYKAFDRLENREVAVKILREEFLDNEEFVRRFRNESKAVGLLSHPNIVRVFDVNFSDSVQYIVMEYIKGITLKDYFDRQGKLSWKDAVFFTEQILRALQHAHDHGIVHRDIKPQNIMLMADGSIKVMDFGIARFSRSETRTITDKAIGSVHYISPEQAKGDMTDFKADIYSLGVMLYEMLTGRLPFESDSAVSVAIKQISDAPTSLREIDANIPEGLEEITLRAMAKDPAKRYQSAAQMLRDIDEFKRNPSIRFEYKYLSDDSPTRYIDTPVIDKDSKKDKVSKKPAKKRKGLTVPLMLGITSACVVGAVVLILMVFSLGNNSIVGSAEDVDLPNFVGMTITDIENGNYKFKFEYIEEYNSAAVGTIYDQKPFPPKKIKENGKVTLYVSKGTESVKIPNVVGMKQAEAFETLQNLGLIVYMEIMPMDGAADNTVVKMSPESGDTVAAGTVVTVYINSVTASSTVAMPDLSGLNYNEAKQLLTINGLRMGKYSEQESPQEKGTIISQTVLPGQMVAQNSEVDVVISSGQSLVTLHAAVKLPYSVDGATSYTATAYRDGEQIGTTNVSSGPTTWNVAITGTGGQSTVTIVVGSKTIYTYTVNFDTSNVAQSGSDMSGVVMDKPSAPTVNKSNLVAAISSGNATLGTAVRADSTEGLAAGTVYVSSGVYDALQNAISAGSSINNDAGATQAQVDAAINNINAQITAFNNSKQTYTPPEGGGEGG